MTKPGAGEIDEVNLMASFGLRSCEVDDLPCACVKPRGGDNVCDGDRGLGYSRHPAVCSSHDLMA